MYDKPSVNQSINQSIFVYLMYRSYHNCQNAI